MPRRRLITLVALLVVAIAGLVWFFYPNDEPLQDLIKDAGYFELIPPSNFHGPGTINTIEVVGDQRLKLHPTCNVDEALLEALTLESRTVDQKLKSKLSRVFDLSAEIGSILAASGIAKQARSVSVTLENVSILLMSDESLLTLQQELIREGCEEAIVWNLNAGSTVCQTQAVLQADISYRIEFEGSVSVDERTKLHKELGGTLKTAASAASEDQIIGEGLFIGVRVAPNGIIIDAPEAKASDCRSLFKQRRNGM